MNKLFSWFAVELAGNVTVAFALGCCSSLLTRGRFIATQGLFLGFATGLSIHNSQENFKNLIRASESIDNSYIEYFYKVIGYHQASKNEIPLFS